MKGLSCLCCPESKPHEEVSIQVLKSLSIPYPDENVFLNSAKSKLHENQCFDNHIAGYP